MPNKKGKEHPQYIDRTGEKILTRQGYIATVIECLSSYRI